MNVQLDFTVPQTPQENCKVERAFAIFWERTRTMLNHAGFDGEHHNGFWTKCAKCCTMLSILLCHEDLSLNQSFHGKMSIMGRE